MGNHDACAMEPVKDPGNEDGVLVSAGLLCIEDNVNATVLMCST